MESLTFESEGMNLLATDLHQKLLVTLTKEFGGQFKIGHIDQYDRGISAGRTHQIKWSCSVFQLTLRSAVSAYIKGYLQNYLDHKKE